MLYTLFGNEQQMIDAVWIDGMFRLADAQQCRSLRDPDAGRVLPLDRQADAQTTLNRLALRIFAGAATLAFGTLALGISLVRA